MKNRKQNRRGRGEPVTAKNLNRRDFLSTALKLSAAGLLVPPFLRGQDVLGSAGNSPGVDGALANMFGTDHTLGGKTLVMIHLKGGNDGVNTVIPFADPTYYDIRPTIAVPSDQVLEIESEVGLHPAMGGLANLYAQGKVAVVQGVGYPEMDLSHFRATDIWMSGSARDVYWETGWVARFLESMFPDFPGEAPPHPYGIQQSFNHRIPLQGDRGDTGVVVDSPESFYSLVLDSYSGEWEDQLPPTRGGKELAFVRRIDRDTFAYAEAIETAANAGTTTVEYPTYSLGRQLEVIAKLVSGNLGTPMFVGSHGGFDTHSDQVGHHDEILARLSDSIAAFMQDLQNQNLDENVLVMVVSEFGRRPEENGSWGTDHGTAAPMFLVGSPVNGGVYGEMPSLNDLDPWDNLLVQHDYRGIYAAVMRDHFGGSEELVEEVLGGQFTGPNVLPAAGRPGGRGVIPTRPSMSAPYPNPASISGGGNLSVRYRLPSEAEVSVDVFDAGGRRVAQLARGAKAQGIHEASWNLGRVAAGTYMVRMRTSDWQQRTKVVVLP